MKAAYILSYKYPDYVRTRVLTKMIRNMDDITLYECINTHSGIFRYVETAARLVWTRITKRPDVYILGFRGAETFLFFRFLTIGRPLIYDEFLSPYLWSVEEHRKVRSGGLRDRLIRAYVRYTIRSSQAVLSDTNLHGEYSARLAGVNSDKIVTMYVGTDEDVFMPQRRKKIDGNFTVFFYGTFLPLHGIDVIMSAAKLLEDVADIRFVIIGGASRQRDMKLFQERLKRQSHSNITHRSWVAFEELPEYIANADLCLGGPFADSPQARVVITGKTYQFLAMSKPTIVGSIEESAGAGFIDKLNCLLLTQNDHVALADAIRWSYDNRSRLDTIGEAGRELYERKFSMRSQSNKLHDVLMSVR